MTTLLTRRDPVDLFAPERRRAPLAVAVVGGTALGIVDLLLQVALPYPWANLANSSALWALVAFGYGVWVGRPGGRVAVGGAVLLVTGVVAYYAAAALTRGDDWSNVWAPSSLAWALFGVLAGVTFALAGAVRGRGGWWAAVAAATAGAVCFAEFVADLLQYDRYTGPAPTDLLATAVLVAAVGGAVLVAAARDLTTTGRAMLVAVPLAAVGCAGFAAAGFAGFSA